MIIYVENLKESTKKLLERRSDDNKIAEYKINIQKSVAFLYTSNEREEFDIKTIIPFYISTLKNEIHIDLTKCVWDLYEENYKIPISKVKN